MAPDLIRDLLRGKPFEPFEVRLSSGEVHRVMHPELALFAGSRFYIYYPETDRVAKLSLLHVTSVTTAENSPSK